MSEKSSYNIVFIMLAEIVFASILKDFYFREVMRP